MRHDARQRRPSHVELSKGPRRLREQRVPSTCRAAVAVEEARRADPTALLQFIAAAKITVCLLPTPLAELVLHARWPAGCDQFRILYTGGEKLKGGGAPPAAPAFRFDNHYG